MTPRDTPDPLRWDIEAILDGDGNDFSSHLIRLIKKSDAENLSKLRAMYPDHVTAVERWNGAPTTILELFDVLFRSLIVDRSGAVLYEAPWQPSKGVALADAMMTWERPFECAAGLTLVLLRWQHRVEADAAELWRLALEPVILRGGISCAASAGGRSVHFTVG